MSTLDIFTPNRRSALVKKARLIPLVILAFTLDRISAQNEATNISRRTLEFQKWFDAKGFGPEAKIFSWESAARNPSEYIDADLFVGEIALGRGINVKTLATAPYLAMPISPLEPPPPKQAGIRVNYTENVHEAVAAIGGGSGLEAQLTTQKFSIGGSFKSDSMRQTSTSSSSKYLVIYFRADYPAIGLTASPSPQILQKAKKDPKAFFEKYGTHYISSAVPTTSFALVYTFRADSNVSMQKFESQVGVDFGVGFFQVGFSDKVQKALESKDYRVSMDFQQYSTGAAGIKPLPEIPAPEIPAPPSPPTGPFYLMNPSKAIESYNDFIASPEKKKVAFTKFGMTPYAKLINPSESHVISDLSVSLALGIGVNIDNMVSDYTLLLGNPTVWTVQPDVTALANLMGARRGIDTALYDLLAYPSTKTADALDDAYIAAVPMAAKFFTLDGLWPKSPHAKLEADSADPLLLNIRFKCDRRLSAPKECRLVTYTATGSVSELVPITSDTAEDDKTSVWQTGKLRFSPAAGTSIRMVISDEISRAYEILIFSSGDTSAPVLGKSWMEMF